MVAIIPDAVVKVAEMMVIGNTIMPPYESAPKVVRPAGV